MTDIPKMVLLDETSDITLVQALRLVRMTDRTTRADALISLSLGAVLAVGTEMCINMDLPRVDVGVAEMAEAAGLAGRVLPPSGDPGWDAVLLWLRHKFPGPSIDQLYTRPNNNFSKGVDEAPGPGGFARPRSDVKSVVGYFMALLETRQVEVATKELWLMLNDREGFFSDSAWNRSLRHRHPEQASDVLVQLEDFLHDALDLRDGGRVVVCAGWDEVTGLYVRSVAVVGSDFLVERDHEQCDRQSLILACEEYCRVARPHRDPKAPPQTLQRVLGVLTGLAKHLFLPYRARGKA